MGASTTSIAVRRPLCGIGCWAAIALEALAVILAVGQSLGSAAEAAPRPNIIFILADDLGIGGVGCYGAEYKTPNLDKLAQTGIRFENCFAAPLCAPSRAMCMTGRYGFRTGVVDNSTGANAHPDKEVPIARLLKQVGYATAVAGKWRQLAHFKTKEDAQRWGFDESVVWGLESGMPNRYWDPVFYRDGQPMEGLSGRYGPDVLHEFVVDFIARCREKPFFIYYPMVLIHSPILPTPDTPNPPGNKRDLLADNIAYMDKLVGKLVDQLERLKLREKTLIVFVGDNGNVGGGVLNGRAIDGGKGSMKEGGSRVPLIVNWPGTVPGGRVLKDLVDLTDFYPTFAELAGVELPRGVTIDGRSFAPQLRGQPGNPRQWVYVQLGQKCYVRDQRLKLTDDGLLLDMSDAPFAEKPAADTPENAAAREKLQSVLEDLRRQWQPIDALKPKPKEKRKPGAGKNKPSAQTTGQAKQGG